MVQWSTSSQSCFTRVRTTQPDLRSSSPGNARGAAEQYEGPPIDFYLLEYMPNKKDILVGTNTARTNPARPKSRISDEKVHNALCRDIFTRCERRHKARAARSQRRRYTG